MKTVPLIVQFLGIVTIASQSPAQLPESAPAEKISFKAEADYLSINITGQAPPRTTKIEYRLKLEDHEAPETWTRLRTNLQEDGSFTASILLQDWRWQQLELRAMEQETVLSSNRTHTKKPALTMLTPEALETLPADERNAWESYLRQSADIQTKDRRFLAQECISLRMPKPKPAAKSTVEFKLESSTPESWYASKQTADLAAVIISFQTPSGGWSKAVDYSQGPRTSGTQWTSDSNDPWHYCATLDNRSTTEQIHFLARVHAAAPTPEILAAALKGIEWLLQAQYPNGGWPQNYPVESGYHEAITLNDNAMLHAIELLQEVADAKPPYTFASQDLQKRAAAAVQRALQCLIQAQVVINGVPTVWCAQHHPLTLEPVAARLKEPPSLSGSESQELLKFLMRSGPITPATTAVIEQGLAWFQANPITHLRKSQSAEGKTLYLEDPDSPEIYWARFYDIETSRPIFAGGQDGVIYHSYMEMAAKNKVTYDYFTVKPAELITKEHERWKKRLAKQP